MGGETTFDEDDGQCGRAEVAGERDIVEPQSDAVFAQQNPDTQEQQQTRQAGPGGQSGGDDAGEQHQGTDEQYPVHLLQRHPIPVQVSGHGRAKCIRR